VGTEQLDAEVVETVAGVVQLLRRAAELGADGRCPPVIGQLLALGIDTAVGEASSLSTSPGSAGGAYASRAEPSRASRIGWALTASNLCH
jgi:hypothetical protein